MIVRCSPRYITQYRILQILHFKTPSFSRFSTSFPTDFIILWTSEKVSFYIYVLIMSASNSEPFLFCFVVFSFHIRDAPICGSKSDGFPLIGSDQSQEFHSFFFCNQINQKQMLWCYFNKNQINWIKCSNLIKDECFEAQMGIILYSNNFISVVFNPNTSKQRAAQFISFGVLENWNMMTLKPATQTATSISPVQLYSRLNSRKQTFRIWMKWSNIK